MSSTEFAINNPDNQSSSETPNSGEMIAVRPNLAELDEDPIAKLVEGVNAESLDEETLDNLIDQDPVVQQKVMFLSYSRKNSLLTQDRDKELVEEIKARRSLVGAQIKSRLGIVEEDPIAREKRQERERIVELAKILATITHEETDDELLVKFGLINEDGSMTSKSMHSPLFREDTRKSFDVYMKYAQQYDVLEQAEAFEGHALRNTAQASNIRTEAHDTVADLVARDLQLPYDAARRFVAKSREAIVPGLHEKTSYAEILRGQKLIEQFGNDALAFTEDSLRPIIAAPMDHEKQ